MVSVIRQEGAQKRSPGGVLLLNIEDHLNEVRAEGDPVEAFDVAWGRQVVGEALRRMQTHCEPTGRSAFWGVFEHRIVAPLLEGAEPVDDDRLIEQYGFKSPN